MESPAMKHYLSVDLDTDVCKVVLAAVAGGSLEIETLHSFKTPLTRMAGKSFWNIYSIYDGVIYGLSIAGARNVPVESIAINSWGSDFVCVAKDGTFLGLPRASGQDRYSGEFRERFYKKIGPKEFFETTGIQPRESGTVFQMMAQDKAKSPALDNAKSVLFISDALIYMLTGKKSVDRTQLSSSGLLNVKRLKTARQILKVPHVKARRFPSCTNPGVKLARLCEEAASATGLGRVSVMSAGNTAATVVPALSMSSGAACLYLGGNAFIGIVSDSPEIDDRSFELNVSNLFLGNGKWLVRCSFPDSDNESLAEKCGTVFRALQAMSSSRLSRLFIVGPYADDEDLKQRIGSECSVEVMSAGCDISVRGNIALQAGTALPAL